MLRLTRDQVRQIDRLAIEQYHIPGVVLMENAARAVVDVACEMLGPAVVQIAGGKVLILCGGGNNGGDGLAVARHLHNRGFEILIGLACDPTKYRDEALANWRIVQAMALPTAPATADLVRSARPILLIDAIFGTGLTAAPRDPFAAIADAVNASGVPVLAVDIPSGLDADTGLPLGPGIRANRTVTFVAEKAGFASPAARPFLGLVTVADIGCPKELIAAVAEGMTVR